MRPLLFLFGVVIAGCGTSSSYTGPLPCGSASCDPATQYCVITYFGHPLDDAGPTSSSVCTPYPDTCGAKSCDCFGGASNTQCGCTETANGVTVGECTP